MLFELSSGFGHRDGSVPDLLGLCLLLRWGEDGFGFGEEVEFVFARDADVTGEGNANRKASQLVISGVVDSGKQNLFGAAVVVLVRDVFGQVIGKGVGIKVDDGAKQDTELRCGKALRGVLKDALEGRLPLLA